MRWPDDAATWLTPPGLIGAWVADIDGTVAGHAALVQPAIPLSATDEPSYELSRLFVSAAARRGGVAGALLDAVVDRATQDGHWLWLEVVENSRSAVAFYEARGWRLLDRSTASWTDARGSHPMLRRYVLPPRGGGSSRGGEHSGGEGTVSDRNPGQPLPKLDQAGGALGT
jgi:ribosomal protein S18 acetylase RimI-like enzyme